MIGDLHNYMTVGIFHHMAFPEAERDDGPILETLEQIVDDDFFGAVEVTRMRDPGVRRAAADLLCTGGLAVDFDAGGQLLAGKLDLNSLDKVERARAVEEVKACVDEACAVGARRVCVVSGPDPGDQNRPLAHLALADSLQQICDFAWQRGELGVVLDLVDRKVEKKRLVGGAADAALVAQAVRERCANFGLAVSLAHLPLLEQTPAECLAGVAPYVVNSHIGNCILKDRTSPLWGDSHPRFGYPGGENGVPELAEFLRQLVQIGYLKSGGCNVVAFAVKPVPGESSTAVIANGKRALRAAWAQL